MQFQTTSVLKKWDLLLYYVLVSFGVTLTALFGVWWFQGRHVPNNFTGAYNIFDLMLFLLLTYVVWYQIINEVFLWVVAYWMKEPQEMVAEKGKRVAFLTAFVPSKEPYEMLEKTLAAMRRCEYLHDTWVLDEGNDERVKKICTKLGVIHFSRKGLNKYNQKDGSLNLEQKPETTMLGLMLILTNMIL